MCVCAYIYIYISQTRINTPLKADHPERPTITLGWSLWLPRGIRNNNELLVDLMISRSGWHGNRGVFRGSKQTTTCAFAQTTASSHVMHV